MEYALVLLWAIMFQALAILGLPIASLLFPRFPDRGATLSLPIALVVVGLVAYWVGHVAFGTPALLAGLGTLGLLAWLLAPEHGPIHWRSYAESMVLFTVVFCLLTFVRAADPAVHPKGGEKFLDFGLLKSLLRTSSLPPEDVWLAGEPVRYYYGGHLLTSLLAELSGIEARYAYNLGVASYYATLITGVYGLGRAISDYGRTRRRIAGGFAVFFVCVASNLYTPIRHLFIALPDAVGGSLAPLVGIPREYVISFTGFQWWLPTRIIPQTINEFPFFTFINNALHGHLMSTPFLVLLTALLYSYYQTPTTEVAHRRAVLAAIPPVLGFIAFVNTWSLPTAVGLVWLALSFSSGDTGGLLPAVGRWQPGPDHIFRTMKSTLRDIGAVRLFTSAVVACLLGVLGVLLVVPFFSIAVLEPGSGSIGVFPKRTELGRLFLIHGTFVLLFGTYLWPRVRSTRDDIDAVTVVPALSGIALAAVTIDFAAVAIIGPLLVGGWILLHSHRENNFETILVVAGAGLVLLVELVYLQDPAAPGRFNTVFKVYMQVWILWGIAAGVVITDLLGDVRTDVGAVIPRLSVSKRIRVTLAVVLVVSLSLYGLLALDNLFSPEPRPIWGGKYDRASNPTLDSLAFVENNYSAEAEAISWLDRRQGRPHIVSAPGRRPYRWVNAPSSLTGLPTVAGWAHASYYHGGVAYYRRADIADTIYTGERRRSRALLDRLQVRYIYVGPVERRRYGDVAFSDYPGVSIAFQNEAATIYAVNETVKRPLSLRAAYPTDRS